MDLFVSFLTAEGIPACVLQQAIRATGQHGGARLTTALAALGPGGMVGGLITLALIQASSMFLSAAMIDGIYIAVVRELCREGNSLETVFEVIEGYPVSRGLKDRLREEAKLRIRA